MQKWKREAITYTDKSILKAIRQKFMKREIDISFKTPNFYKNKILLEKCQKLIDGKIYFAGVKRFFED